MVNQTVNGALETTSIDETNSHNDVCQNKDDANQVTNGATCTKDDHEISQVIKRGKSDGEYANFDPHKYIETYYESISGGRDDWDYVPKALKFWLDTFNEADFSGDELLELGVGPILVPAICASRRFKRIYLADYAEVNIKAVHMWIDKHPDAYNWRPFCEYIAKRESNGMTADQVELRARNAIQDVFFCDINNANPIAPQSPRQFDCVIAAGVLECGSANHEDYKRNVRNIASLVKPGGWILADGDINENFYYLDGVKFFVLNLDTAFTRAAFEDAGFEDLEFFQHNTDERSTVEMFDAEGYWQLRARKRS